MDKRKINKLLKNFLIRFIKIYSIITRQSITHYIVHKLFYAFGHRKSMKSK